MLSIFLNVVLPVIGSFAIGAAGWLTTYFVARPILRLQELRERALELIIDNANVSPDFPGDQVRRDAACRDFRLLSTKLSALDVGPYWFARWWFRLRGFDIHKAAANAIGMSNSLNTRGLHTMVARHKLERSLKLPLSDTTESVQQAWDNHVRRE